MFINHLEIKSFAGLKDYELSLGEGFNCFYGPNERGKSTIFQFIIAMFYGLGDRRAKNNLRDRLTPRDGSAMAGSIWFTHKGKSYELNRKFGERAALDESTLLDLTSNTQIELRNLDKPGEDLFGVSREVFENTLLVDAEGPVIKQENSINNAIWEQLIDFMVNDDAEVSVNQVETRLSDKLYALKSKSGKKGSIPVLEQEYQELLQEESNRESNIEKQSNSLAALSNLEEMIHEYNEEYESLNNELRVENLAEDRLTLRMLEQPEETLRGLDAEKTALMENLQSFGKTSNEVADNIRLAKEQIDDLSTKDFELSRDKKLWGAKQDKLVNDDANSQRVNLFLLLTSVVVIIVLWYYFEKNIALPVSIAVLVVLTIYIFLQYFSRKNVALGLKGIRLELDKLETALKAEKLALRKILKGYGLAFINGTYEQVSQDLDRFLEQSQDLEFIQKQIVGIEKSLEESIYSPEDRLKIENNIKEEAEDLESLGFDVDNIEFNYQRQQALMEQIHALDLRISERESELSSLNAKLNYLLRNPRTGKLESPLEQISRVRQALEEKSKQLKAERFEYSALEIAQEVLAESLLDFRQTVLPKLNEQAGQYMKAISNGKYKDVYISESLELLLRDKNNKQSLDPESFSTGTRDQVWFAYRLALTDYLSAGNSFPLLLDDLFANFDDRRIKASVELIGEWSKSVNGETRQVILFTCHKHVVALLEEYADWNIKVLPK